MPVLPPMQGTLLTVSWRDHGFGTFVLVEDISNVKKMVRDSREEDQNLMEIQVLSGETYFIDVWSVCAWSLEVVNLADPGLPSTRSRSGVNRRRNKTRRLLEGKSVHDS